MELKIFFFSLSLLEELGCCSCSLKWRFVEKTKEKMRINKLNMEVRLGIHRDRERGRDIEGDWERRRNGLSPFLSLVVLKKLKVAFLFSEAHFVYKCLDTHGFLYLLPPFSTLHFLLLSFQFFFILLVISFHILCKCVYMDVKAILVTENYGTPHIFYCLL